MLGRKPTIRRARRRSSAGKPRRCSAPVLGQGCRSPKKHESTPPRMCKTPQPIEINDGSASSCQRLLFSSTSKNEQSSPCPSVACQGQSDHRLTASCVFPRSLQNSSSPQDDAFKTSPHFPGNVDHTLSPSVQPSELHFSNIAEKSITKTSSCAAFAKVSHLLFSFSINPCTVSAYDVLLNFLFCQIVTLMTVFFYVY